MASIKKHRFVWLWYVVGVFLSLAALLVVHPWLFGLPGRLGEIRLERTLHKGMSRAEVANLKTATGALEDFYRGSDQARDDVKSGAMAIPYADWSTFCAGGGKLYVVYFDKSDHVRSWRSEDWIDGC